MRSWLAPLFGLCLALSPTAQAHLLKVFAYSDGQALAGNSYFAGGSPARGASIRLYRGEQLIASQTSDERGDFRFELTQRGPYRIVADSGDGHQARWQLAGDTHSDTPAATANTEPAQPHAIEAAIERALARQLGPLRLELQQQADRARLSDIVGGIGFIFGLAGMLLWWRNRP